MNKAARTRCWSFSLRSLFIGIAVVMLCAWFLHYRRQQVLERDRLMAMFQARDSSIGFRYVLLGWEKPFESRWFSSVAFPVADRVRLRAAEGQPLPSAFCEIARRFRKVEYDGSAGGEDDFLRRCTSANTQEITVIRNGVSGDCLAFARDCPNLRKVTCKFVMLRSKSLESLLNHPGVEELEIGVTADDLSRVQALQAPSALQRLVIDVQFDPAAFASEPLDSQIDKPPWERPPSGDFVWLRQCTQLEEVTFTMKTDGAFFASLAQAQSSPQREQTFEKEITLPLSLRYLLYLPPGYEKGDDRWPLILFLHGAGETGDDLEKVKVHGPPKIVEGGRDLPFVIVSPQSPQRGWNVLVLNALLDEVLKSLRIDPDRVYLTGLSMGGRGTWELAAAYPERFAAIVPICGSGNPGDGRKLKDIPVWAFHGALDKGSPPERSEIMVEAIQKAGGSAKLTIYPDAEHDSWTATYDNPELYLWLLAQKRK